MTFGAIFRKPGTWFFIGFTALALSACIGDIKGLQGMAMGLVGAIFGVAALWMLIKWLGTAATAGASPRLGSLLTLLAFAAKIPLYVVLWRLSSAIGGSASGCFIAGVVLVYFAVVAWAVSAEVGDKSAT